MRRLLPCVILLFARPASPAQQHDDRSPTFPKFESSAHVSDKCMACARILDCLKEGLLPRLRHLQEVKRRSYSKSKYQRLGAVGGLEEIIEEEVERLCVCGAADRPGGVERLDPHRVRGDDARRARAPRRARRAAEEAAEGRSVIANLKE